MSCFDLTTCSTNQTFNRINCNFTIGYVEYICNPTITCQRIDNLYDCCASNISDCIIERLQFQLLPTTSPIILPNVASDCDTTCNIAPSTNNCYWYESQNLDISCISKDNKYCCPHSRDDCCQTSMTYMYVTFGSLFILFTLCVYYKWFVYRYTRTIPEQNTPNPV